MYFGLSGRISRGRRYGFLAASQLAAAGRRGGNRYNAPGDGQNPSAEFAASLDHFATHGGMFNNAPLQLVSLDTIRASYM